MYEDTPTDSFISCGVCMILDVPDMTSSKLFMVSCSVKRGEERGEEENRGGNERRERR